MARNIVIAGGGFAGFYAARALARSLPRQSANITVVSESNFLLYSPLLPAVAGGALNPRHVTIPLREALDGAHLRIGRVSGWDAERRRIRFTSIERDEIELHYDQLIVALGSVSRIPPVRGLAEHGAGFKSIIEALHLRDTLLRRLEIAETEDRPERRSEHLTFVVVGGGYTGVEVIAELQDLAASILHLYPRCAAHGTRWLLVESGEQVMAEVPADLAEFTSRELTLRGIEVLTGTRLEGVTQRAAQLSDGQEIPARTVVWTAGVAPSPAIAELGLPVDRHGRVRVDECMQVDGCPDVWALGDCAAVPDPADPGRPCPPTAQHAMRQGAHVAVNVAAALSHGERRPFRFRTLGLVVDLGRRQAVAKILGFKLRGRLAWLCARGYHLMAIPGLARRVRLIIDWNVDLFFRRDTAEWIPPRLPRLSLATMREPDAIEISIRSAPARAGESRADPEAASANASK
jgi:NADH:ubiquinone reductase (H+-translocating)